jgi:hypothetical protein
MRKIIIKKIIYTIILCLLIIASIYFIGNLIKNCISFAETLKSILETDEFVYNSFKNQYNFRIALIIFMSIESIWHILCLIKLWIKNKGENKAL